ncbi:MAG: phosphate uptake regulator [Natronomonas sp.]|jgi:phosphate uptake regulator|uniref:PhoU domain-containing protein n=1 Tax=Natronomonas sp. TaxID=2184060 RepID=UPI003989AC9D
MDSRKIQSVGSGTYTVSLPKDWVESQDIAKGDLVNLHPYIDGVLALQVQEHEGDPSTRVVARVDHDEAEPLERTLRAAYAVGATEVMLEATEQFTTDQRQVVSRVTRTLAGVSVVEESDSMLRVRTLLDTAEVSVRQSVRQLTFVALSMHRDAMAAVTGDIAPTNLSNRDDQADRLYAMIDRSLALGLARLDEVDALGVTRPELFELWATTRELERVADHAEGIVTAATEIDDAVDESIADEICALARLAREITSDAVSVIVDDTDIETAHQALNARDQIRDESTTVERGVRASSNGGPQLRLVLDKIRRTAEHGGNIAELGLRHEIRHGAFTEPMQEAESTDDPEQDPHASTGG